jgi:hypothetical protein
MLGAMSARQLAELLAYLAFEADSKERSRIEAQESKLKEWFSRKIKNQQSRKNG